MTQTIQMQKIKVFNRIRILQNLYLSIEVQKVFIKKTILGVSSWIRDKSITLRIINLKRTEVNNKTIEINKKEVKEIKEMSMKESP